MELLVFSSVHLGLLILIKNPENKFFWAAPKELLLFTFIIKILTLNVGLVILLKTGPTCA